VPVYVCQAHLRGLLFSVESAQANFANVDQGSHPRHWSEGVGGFNPVSKDHPQFSSMSHKMKPVSIRRVYETDY